MQIRRKRRFVLLAGVWGVLVLGRIVWRLFHRSEYLAHAARHVHF
jgi:hypothetical protein